jgi:hypothetical protein
LYGFIYADNHLTKELSMMDTVKSFLRGVMDVAMVVIPLSVVLGVIFGPAVPFIGADTIDNISALVADLGGRRFLAPWMN